MNARQHFQAAEKALKDGQPLVAIAHAVLACADKLDDLERTTRARGN